MADHSRTGDPEMIALMSEETAWFGFAPRSFRGEIVDGKRRMAAAEVLRIKVPKPVELRNALEVARWLALQRHFARSLAWQRERLGQVVPLHVPREIAGELRALDRADAKAIAHRRVVARGREKCLDRAVAIGRLNSLLRCIEGRGYGASALELRDALGEWAR